MTAPAQPAPATGNGAQPGTVVYPLGVYNWRLESQGMAEAHFVRCSGLGVSVQAPRFRAAGTRQVVHRLIGRVEYADVRLEYGLTASKEMFDWMMSAVQGTVQRRNVSIVMLDADGSTEKLRWNLSGVWPREWRGAVLD